jgi:hypothetical protein
MSVASVAQLLQEQGGGSGGGSVNDIIAGEGITITVNSFGDYTVDNDGVLDLTAGAGISITGSKNNYTITNTGGGGGGGVTSIIAGNGISVDANTGDVTVTSDVNPADYYTSTQSDALFQTLADMANYSTTAVANGLYQAIGNYLTPSSLNPYSTTAQANALYQTIANMANYSTTAQANALYYPAGKIGTYQLTFNTSVLTAGAIIEGNFTIPNFNSSAQSMAVMTSNAIEADNVAYVCNLSWNTNQGGALYYYQIFNPTTTDGANNLRAFSVIVINP